MKVTWLGQAGLLLKAGGLTVMIDPYLSNSVGKQRFTPIKEEIFAVKPDVMVFTHDHLDHYDPETAPVFLSRQEKPMTVLSPTSVWQKARQQGGVHNYVEFNRHTQWTERGLRFRAVKATHSDPFAIGVIIEDLEEEKTWYITGDTLYNSEIFGDLPERIDGVFLPINGVGNNMNVTDAEQFARRVGAKITVPIHWGMFDTLNASAFGLENKKILKVYEETEL